MRKIYTGIDFGSDSIKIVISEFLNNKFHILASTNVKSRGIKRGLIIDIEKARNSLNNAIKNIEDTIGFRINEAVINVASNDRILNVVSGSIDILGEYVTGDDISCVLEKSTENKIEEGYELVNIIPIVFSIDDREGFFDPKGKTGSNLSVKAVMITVPKEIIHDNIELCNLCNISVKDIILGTIGDYYEAKGKDTDSEVGAVVNIGSDKIDVSIFNKGIIIKNDIINLGSRNIDKDIAYVYGLNVSDSRDLKENFSVCSRKYADANDQIEIKLSDSEILKINQYEISEIVEARVTELLKLAKKSINSLTNRKISYIIVTGGITELTGFGYVVENVLGINASILNITTMGIRNNKYSSVIGIIKYFHDKLKLKGIEYSMFDEDEIESSLNNMKNSLNINNETIVSKIFGYFTNN